MKKRLILLFLAALLPSIAQLFAYYIQSYGAGLIIRIVFHLIIPIIAVSFFTKISLKNSFLLPLHLHNKKTTFFLAAVGSMAAFIIICGALFIFNEMIDFNLIAQTLNYSVDKKTYVLVALAIVLINPFLEEYFWRGFVFRVFDKYWDGYWTGILFALHHAIIIAGWFNWWQFFLVIIFLSLVGIIFNWLYKKTQSIYSGWIIHIIADLIIVAIGWIYMFE